MPMVALGIASLGGMIGSALHNKKIADAQLKEQKKNDALAQQHQAEMLKFLQPYGQTMAQHGAYDMNTVGNLLRGQINSRQSGMQANAPIINQMAQQQQGGVQAMRSLLPRGGQSASQAANLPYQLQGNISNTLMAGRQNAIGQLGQLGSNQASLGLGAMGQGAGLTNSMLNYGLQAQQQMFGQGAAIGQGVSSLFGPALNYWMMNRSGGTSPQSQTPYLPSSGHWGSLNSGSLAPGADPYGSLNNMYTIHYSAPPVYNPPGEGYE